MRLAAWLSAWLALSAWLLTGGARAEGLSAGRLGVLFSQDDASSRAVAAYYAAQRGIPPENVLGIHLPAGAVISPQAFKPIRDQVLERLPAEVQGLLLVWSKPYAVGCMSITTAIAAGYRPGFCEPGCGGTLPNPLFDTAGWLPADTVGWWPAMLLPSDDVARAEALIQRGVSADGSAPPGTLYLVRTADAARNVRAASYDAVQNLFAHRLTVAQLAAPVAGEIDAAVGYFTGAARVEELPRIRFRAGAVADHLTSSGGVLDGSHQMAASAWLDQGATASYGSVSEPCNVLGKFPNIGVLFEHYLHGETVLESYWKSIAMPGQGLIVGEPLSRPYAAHSR